jgi:lon-related putative ATP-dependent protease
MNTDELELSPEQLRRACSVEHFNFKTTADLSPERKIIGQPRGVRAIEFGIDIRSPGFNIYVLGPSGTGRTTAISQFLEDRAITDEVPRDWVYVNNFKLPHQPNAISLSAGQGVRLRDDMASLIEYLRREIPRALETEEFQKEMEKHDLRFQEQRDQRFQAVQDAAHQQNLTIMQGPSGLAILPFIDGKPVPPEQIESLDAALVKQLEASRTEIAQLLEDAMRELHELEKQTNQAKRDLECAAAANVFDRQLAEMHATYADNYEVLTYLDAVRADVLDNLTLFKDSGSEEQPESPVQAMMQAQYAAEGQERFRKYRVNVMVDHSQTKGAPVVVEELPTYPNLVGRIEGEVRMGALRTDFTMIKPGALHQANGGYLVLNVIDLLKQPFSWDGLKHALNSAEIRIEDLALRMGAGVLTPQQTIEPEPIPLNVKVVLLSPPQLYYLLYGIEEDFSELFKVKADFDSEMPRDNTGEDEYAVFIAARCSEENLLHFTPAAVGKVVEYGSWLVDDQNKLSTLFGTIADVVREAAYWASRADSDVVDAEHVRQAIQERDYRANELQERIQGRIADGTIFIDTEGEVVGQINGLSIVNLGDLAFGQPSRVTARIYMGKDGVIDIEREVEMSGPIHNKGVLTLRGYLGGQYATEHPLSMSASITFEQNYSGVEGDSAASTELYALLSALSALPLRQDIAVTGSVNQKGEVQPIGGATQKIEGFFDVCKARDLTGRQGVIIPRANAKDLMLREDVVEAVKTGQFHIYAVENVDQGIEILTGTPAGQRVEDGSYPEGTVHHAVQARLRALAEGIERFGKSEKAE